MNNYKIKSYKVLECLPFGVTHVSEIPVQEISKVLKNIVDHVNKSSWLLLTLQNSLGYSNAWTMEALNRNLNDVISDIIELKSRLKDG